MGVKVSVKGIFSGPKGTVSGKKAGAFTFLRNPDQWSEHVLEFKTAAAFNAVADELLTTPGNPKMFVRVLPETAPEDTALKAQVSELLKAAENHTETVEGLQQQIAKLTHDAETARGNSPGLTPTQSAMLAERDAFMVAMEQYATEGETPIACLARLLAKPPAPDNLTRAEVKTALSYHQLLAAAKALGFTTKGNNPKRDVLETFLREKSVA